WRGGRGGGVDPERRRSRRPRRIDLSSPPLPAPLSPHLSGRAAAKVEKEEAKVEKEEEARSRRIEAMTSTVRVSFATRPRCSEKTRLPVRGRAAERRCGSQRHVRVNLSWRSR
ncbi:Os03g0644700, partial [Oryza sativa Japonica Group]